jgi:hypothetical protein
MERMTFEKAAGVTSIKIRNIIIYLLDQDIKEDNLISKKNYE